MRNVRWGSPLGIALIGAGGTIAAALIVGSFALAIALTDSKKIVASSSPDQVAETQFLGHGYANVEGPQTISTDSSATVSLTVSLAESVSSGSIIWKATAAGQPPIKAGSASGAGALDAALVDVPIYKQMSARLDAPGFTYVETNWVTKEVLRTEPALWSWNISPLHGVGSQVVTIFLKGPEGSNYEATVQLEVEVIVTVSGVPPGPTVLRGIPNDRPTIPRSKRVCQPSP